MSPQSARECETPGLRRRNHDDKSVPRVAGGGGAVIVNPGNIGAEAQANQWTFSLTAEMAAVVTVADVEA